MRANELISAIREQLAELEKVIDLTSLCQSIEAAEILGVSPTTICTYLKQGKLHKVKIGLKTGIPLGEILELKEARS